MGETIFDKIVAWSTKVNIIGAGTVEGQSIKLLEEVGEIFGGIARKDVNLTKDAVGDVLVIMTNIAMMEPTISDRPIDLGTRISSRYADIKPSVLAFGIAKQFGAYFEEDALSFPEQDLKDVYRDVVERLAVIAAHFDFTLSDAAHFAYDQIKDREGVFYNDVFVKMADFNADSVKQMIASGTLSDTAIAALNEWLTKRA